MAEVVLDSSALLALLNVERGAEVVSPVMSRAAMSSLNLSEVVAKLADYGMQEDAIRTTLNGLPLEIVPFDQERAFLAGLLRRTTRDAGLSLGDRCCISLAIQLGMPALTADRSWQRIAVGAEIRQIR